MSKYSTGIRRCEVGLREDTVAKINKLALRLAGHTRGELIIQELNV